MPEEVKILVFGLALVQLQIVILRSMAMATQLTLLIIVIGSKQVEEPTGQSL